MKKLLASTVLAAGIMGFAGTASAEDCGRVTIANMNWASAEVLANIDKIILEEGYGCDAELVAGDTQPTLTSMIEKGEPDVAPEAWVNAMRTVLDKATDEGKLHYASESLSEGGVEGWWIPKYIADEHPDIKTVEDALAHPELFHPFMAEENVTPDYPPTMMIHGDEDTDVPYECSTAMAAVFAKHGVPHELITIEGGEHGFGGAKDPAQIDAAYDRARSFMAQHWGVSAPRL